MKPLEFNEPHFRQDWDEQFDRVRDWLRRRILRLVPIGLTVLAVVWRAAGIYVVRPGQVGVVRTFGKEPAFYRFVRGLESYETFLPERSTLLRSANSQVFRDLAGRRPEDDAKLSLKPSPPVFNPATASK